MMAKNPAGVDPEAFRTGSLNSILATSHVVALAVLRDGGIVFTNPAFQALFRSTFPLTGARFLDCVAEVDREPLAAALETAKGKAVVCSSRGLRAGAPLFDVEFSLESAVLDGEPAVVAFASDTSDRHRHDEQLGYLAYSDPLTSLPNRALFADRLRQAILTARRDGSIFAVLMGDLDGFKDVNDTYGHDAGDAVLRLTAERLRSCLRENDTLARLGGDEFGVVLPWLKDRADAAVVAQRMIDALKEKLHIGTHAVAVGISIGIGVYPENANAIDPLLAAADAALYQAKRAGRRRFIWASGKFDSETTSTPPAIWSVAHAVGIQEIDDQHAHLAALIDDLSATLKDAAGNDRVAAGLGALVSYTRFHFAAEEQLMARFEIESLVRHRDAHGRLLDDIQKLGPEVNSASTSLILRYLQEWLLRHVDSFDKELGQELIAKGYQ